MTTETTGAAGEDATDGDADGTDAADPAEYRVRLDRAACEGVFACLVRDGRFVEAADGLATLTVEGDELPDERERAAADGAGGGTGAAGSDDARRDESRDELVATFADGRLDDARTAARACPVDAIEVTALSGEATGADDE
jgi:ferredoxin